MPLSLLHYNILKKLGEGGMGIVHLAQDTRLNRKVALKFLPKHVAKDETEHRRFELEAQAAAGLNHPNIAQVYAIEETEDDIFIVLEFVEGKELKDVIKEDDLTNDEKIDITHQISKGLQAAHEKGIIHRDIKTGNIMIDSSKRVKIMDFGLARLEGSDHITKQGTTVGTTAYMSPEQLRGVEADYRSDIWSFGVVLYELFTGKLPFEGLHEPAIMYSITEEEPASINSDDVPEYINNIIQRCLKKNPDDRYQSFREVITDLDGESQSRPTSINNVFGSLTRTVYLASAIVILVFLGTLFFFFQGDFLDTPDDVQQNMLADVLQKKYLAVLPIENIDGSPEMQVICAGLAETLSFRLSELEQYEDSYWVTPASEIRKENVLSASQANKIFGVNLAISSSIRTIQDSTRLILELIDADNVRRLGTQQVVVHSENLAMLEQESVRAMLNMLEIEIRPNMERTLRSGIPAEPRAYEYYLKGRASLQEDAGQEILQNAIGHFNQALDIDPNFALAYAGLGESYWRQYVLIGNTDYVDMAESALNRAQSLNDELPPVQYLMGLIKSGTGEYEEAISRYERAIELDPKYSDAYSGMAKAYNDNGEPEQAVSLYQQAIDIKPGYWAGYRDLGVHYYYRGEMDKAIENFEKVIELTPNNSYAYSNLGGVYYYQGEMEKARRMFERALELDNTPANANNLASIYFVEGNYEEAAEMYGNVVEEWANRYEIWGNYAAATEWTGDEVKASELYRTAIKKAEQQLEVNPNDPIVLADIATYNSDVGNRNQAIQSIEKALAIDNENLRVRQRAISTYENLGMRSEALKWITPGMTSELEGQPEYQALTNSPEYQELKSEFENQEK